MANNVPQPQVPVAAALSPLAVPAFRMVWVAVLITNIGGWLASFATAWLMTSLDPSPLMVSQVSAATSLPLFLFALPAGALADIAERHKLLILDAVLHVGAGHHSVVADHDPPHHAMVAADLHIPHRDWHRL